MLDQLSGAPGDGLTAARARSGLRFFDVDPAQSEPAFQEIVGYVLEV